MAKKEILESELTRDQAIEHFQLKPAYKFVVSKLFDRKEVHTTTVWARLFKEKKIIYNK
jgi:hypothetical protein